VLRVLHAAQGSRPAGRSANALAKRLRLHHDELNAVLEALEDMGLVARTAEQRWVLTCDPRTTTLEPVFDRFLLDRGQPRLRDEPEIAAVAAGVLGQGPDPTLADLAGVAQNTDIGPAAAVLQLETGKK
ncbi:hypothetical protein OMF50_18865, partial [Bordetella pertussis]